MYLLLSGSFFIFFFSLLQSECKGCRNEEGTSVHNPKTSSPSVLPLPSSLPSLLFPPIVPSSFLVMAVAVLCSRRVSRCSCRSRNEETRNSQSESSRTLLTVLTLVGYYFYSVSSLVAARATSLATSASFHLRVVLYHRDCIARVYVIRICPKSRRSPARPTVFFRGVQFSDKNESCTSPPCHRGIASAQTLAAAINWKTGYVEVAVIFNV